MKARLEKCDPTKNVARYYQMSVLPNLFGEWTLRREWGRIGRGGQMRLDLFRSLLEAEDALKSLTHAKEKHDYQIT